MTCSVSEAMAVAADFGRLPEWAAGFASGVQRDERDDTGRSWLVDAPFGRVQAVFEVDVERGILDHDVTMPDGSVVHNRLRIETAVEGCAAVFTLVRRPGMSDADIVADVTAVTDDLRRLRALCERMDA
ncbi:MAG: hypothetical protein B7Y93_03215 [Micrococcales bacterium 32-70-13]|nr:MAG: hypothetical protein B7Y93_03215 [Micrococcales bacterium 32-70-13]